MFYQLCRWRALSTDPARRERGAIAVEYALLALLIAIFLVASVTAVRDALAAMYTTIGNVFT